jgi:hypothetical protein
MKSNKIILIVFLVIWSVLCVKIGEYKVEHKIDQVTKENISLQKRLNSLIMCVKILNK